MKVIQVISSILFLFTINGCGSDSSSPTPDTAITYINNSDITISKIYYQTNLDRTQSQGGATTFVQDIQPLLPGSSTTVNMPDGLCGVRLWVVHEGDFITNRPSDIYSVPCGSSNFECTIDIIQGTFVPDSRPTTCRLIP